MQWWERLKILVQNAGITPEELAARSGVHINDKRFCVKPANPSFPEVQFGAPNGLKGFVVARVIRHVRDI